MRDACIVLKPVVTLRGCVGRGAVTANNLLDINLLEPVQMNFSKTIATFALIAAAVPAVAAQATLDFEGTGSFGSVLEFYNGGTDAAGNSGTNFGVSFTASATSLSNDDLSNYFSHAPTAGSVMLAPDSVAFLNGLQ